MTRTLGEANWCTLKHLLLAKVHMEETLEKLYRSCDSKCRIDRVTQHEFLEGIKNLLAAEEHLLEVLSKRPEIEEVRRIVDEIRKLRQVLTSKFLFKTEVEKDVVKDIEDGVGKIQKLIEEIKELKLPIEQEQLECERCEEDLGKLTQEYEKVLRKEDVNNNVCGVPVPADVIEGVVIYAPEGSEMDQLLIKFRQAIEESPELKDLIKKAKEAGLRRIYIDCSPKNYRTVAYCRLFSNGCVIHIHPEVLKQSPECIRHILAHELAHCLGYLSEEAANKIASKFGSCPPISISKRLKTKTVKYNRETMWLELGGAFLAKAVSKVGKYFAKKQFVGKKPHERPDFYIDLALSAAGLFIAWWKPTEWYGKLALGMACNRLPDVIDYIEEYASTATYVPEYVEAGTEAKYEVPEEMKEKPVEEVEGGFIG